MSKNADKMEMCRHIARRHFVGDIFSVDVLQVGISFFDVLLPTLKTRTKTILRKVEAKVRFNFCSFSSVLMDVCLKLFKVQLWPPWRTCQTISRPSWSWSVNWGGRTTRIATRTSTVSVRVPARTSPSCRRASLRGWPSSSTLTWERSRGRRLWSWCCMRKWEQT